MMILGLILLEVGLMESGPAGAAAPTCSREIAPILWKNCAGCHRLGEVGPDTTAATILIDDRSNVVAVGAGRRAAARRDRALAADSPAPKKE